MVHSPIEKIKDFRPLDEPERVLGVGLPHEQVLHQELVVLVRALHVQVRKKLDQTPACFAFLERITRMVMLCLQSNFFNLDNMTFIHNSALCH
jgi:hypothetical protein